MISVTYAGAGGGKTTSMVKSIIEKVPDLNDHRFLCIITYTNDATKSIKNKLSEEIQLPPNIFVGTIHSFLFRFIFKPHFSNGSDYSIVSGLPKKEDEISKYIEWAKRTIEDPVHRERVITKKWNTHKDKIYKALDDSNLITNDLLVKKSKELVSKSRVRNALSRKLQFIFVDEYQDTYKWLHEIFLNIYRGGRTELHAIGDPNQSIYGFSYGSSENGAQRPKSFKDFPICQLKNSCNRYTEKDINYRSSTEIVTLANTYNRSFQQKSDRGSFSPIFAIETNKTAQILQLFHERRRLLALSGSIFFLSTNNKSLLPYEESLKNKLENKDRKCIRTFEKCIAQYVGLSITSICSENNISRIQFRSLAITLSKEIDVDLEKIKLVFKSKFGENLTYVKQTLGEPSIQIQHDDVNSRVLTIHKSKGLEAESVLLLFKTNNHIKKSFNQKTLMESATDDDLRLVYVAITRAKKLLVIACKEKISEESRRILEQHNIQFID
ncbi:UvrD-helicase domain-containing protein [Vibrio sp. ZF 223]|uniref:UvrD-helicase domain-containing protein n=1 Tax=Vibrio sp. ZF 223 TaxID=2056191 RepID=UPI000D355A2F|nr:ATP-dependent helicase [Vibrio sp. ZF 223]PTP99718.1 hypothetical protein CWO13_18940 [Vibrio sp. ZF 223]